VTNVTDNEIVCVPETNQTVKYSTDNENLGVIVSAGVYSTTVPQGFNLLGTKISTDRQDDWLTKFWCFLVNRIDRAEPTPIPTGDTLITLYGRFSLDPNIEVAFTQDGFDSDQRSPFSPLDLNASFLTLTL